MSAQLGTRPADPLPFMVSGARVVIEGHNSLEVTVAVAGERENALTVGAGVAVSVSAASAQLGVDVRGRNDESTSRVVLSAEGPGLGGGQRARVTVYVPTRSDVTAVDVPRLTIRPGTDPARLTVSGQGSALARELSGTHVKLEEATGRVELHGEPDGRPNRIDGRIGSPTPRSPAVLLVDDTFRSGGVRVGDGGRGHVRLSAGATEPGVLVPADSGIVLVDGDAGPLWRTAVTRTPREVAGEWFYPDRPEAAARHRHPDHPVSVTGAPPEQAPRPRTSANPAPAEAAPVLRPPT